MRNYWKNIIVTLSVIFWVAFAGQAAAAESWAQVADQIETEQAQAMKDAAVTEQLVQKDQATLERELADLKAEERRADRDLNALKKEFENLLKEEDQLNADLANEQEEIEAVQGTVRAAAREAASLFRDNPITPEYLERLEFIEHMLSMTRFPRLEEIKQLLNLLFQEAKATGTIVRRTGDFVGPDGKMTTGEILRVGKLTTYYRMSDGSVGFLKPESSGERLIAVTGDVPGSIKDAINAYYDKKSPVAPIDPSGGAAFAQLTSQENFQDWLEKGGTLMYPILIVGIVAILIGLERLVVLMTKARASDKIMERIKDMAIKGMWTEAREFCTTKSRIPTCSMLDGVMEHVGATQEVLENALQEAILRQMPKLERFLPTLNVLGQISPLLGLLGTVTGMINTFQVITQVGTGDPRMMSGGISEALLTTQFGLIVAVPIMLIHHLLERKVDRIVGDMQEKGMSFAVSLIKSGATVEG